MNALLSCGATDSTPDFDIDAEDPGADYLAITIEPRVELRIDAIDINAKSASNFKVIGPPETLEKLRKAGLDVGQVGAGLSAGQAGVCGVLSKSAEVDVPEEYREPAGIPTEGPPKSGEGNGHGPRVSYCYIHPLASEADRKKILASNACDLSRNSWAFVLLVGGYAYFNQKKELIWVNAIQFAPNDSHGLLLVGHEVPTARHAFEAMKQHGRMVEVRDEHLLKAGFQSFGWVHSSEKFPCGTDETSVSEEFPYINGAFLYSRNTTGSPGQEMFYLYSLMTPRAPPDPGAGVGEGSWYHACVARARFNIKQDEEDAALSRTQSGRLEQTTTLSLQAGTLSNAYAAQIRSAMTAEKDRKDAGNLGSLRTDKHDDERSAVTQFFSLDNLLHVGYLAAYVAVGIVFYTTAHHQEGGSLSDSEYSDDERVWSFTESFYFAVVTMSTVGYGDLSPELPGAKVFTAGYIMLGVGMVFGHAGELYDSTVSLCYFLLSKLFCSACCRKDAADAPTAEAASAAKYASEGDADGGIDLSTASGKLERYPDDEKHWWQRDKTCRFFLSKLWMNVLVGILLNIFFSAYIFTLTEPGMSYWAEAVWHCFVTSTTVGYGDVSLTTVASQRWASFQILISVSWLASLLSAISAASTEREYILTRAKALKKLLDPTLIDKLGGTRSKEDLLKIIKRPGHHPRTQVRGKGALSELEFVVGMLEVQGAQLYGEDLTWDDHAVPLLRMFHRLDQDDSGTLDSTDLKHMREQACEQSSSAKDVMQGTFKCLNTAITHAKEAQWDELIKLLYPQGSETGQECSLSDDLINTVPLGHSGQPRLYGLLHQLAYWGDNADNGLENGPKKQSLVKTGADVYKELKQRGITFDLGLRTRNGKGQTAYDVAVEHKQDNFAQTLKQDQLEADRKKIEALTTEIQSRKTEIEQLESILERERTDQTRSQNVLAELRAQTEPEPEPELELQVIDLGTPSSGTSKDSGHREGARLNP